MPDLTISSILGLALVVLVFAAIITDVGVDLNTAATNGNIVALGIGGLIGLVALVFVIVVIRGLARHAE